MSPATAWALPPCNQPGPCDPNIAPPAAIDHQRLEAEAHHDPALQEQARRAAWQDVEDERRNAWLAHGRTLARGAVPLRTPRFELDAQTLFRGFAGRNLGHFGAASTLRVQWQELFFAEVLGSISTLLSDRDRYATWSVEPSFGVMGSLGNFQHGRAYGGLMFGGPLGSGDDGRGPRSQLGGKIGLGATHRLMAIDGGYFGIEYDVEGLLLGGFGAGYGPLGTPRGGLGLRLGLVIAL